MRHFLILLIRGYQYFLSPLFPPSCRFIPSCSEYARQALDRHGIPRGLLLTAWRILRCQPLCAGGFDPVPEKWPGRLRFGAGKASPPNATLNQTSS